MSGFGAKTMVISHYMEQLYSGVDKNQIQKVGLIQFTLKVLMPQDFYFSV